MYILWGLAKLLLLCPSSLLFQPAHCSSDFFDDLVKRGSHRFGRMVREPGARVPLARWSKREFSYKPFKRWLAESLIRGSTHNRVPPMSHRWVGG